MEEKRSFNLEEWKQSSRYPNYEVSTEGRVRRSLQTMSMPGQIMQRLLNKQNRLWVMVRNAHSQQVRVDIAELVAETFLGHVPGKTSIIFVESTKDPSANNLRVHGCESAKKLNLVGERWNAALDDFEVIYDESAAELEQRALFEQALIDGSDPQ